MASIRLAAAAAVTLLVATGCGTSEVTGSWDLFPTGGAEGTEQAPGPTPSGQAEQVPRPTPSEDAGPRAEGAAPGSEPGPGAEGTGSRSPEPTAEPGPEPEVGGEGPSTGAPETPGATGTSGRSRTSETPEETVEEYVDALAAVDDPDRMRQGLEYAAEGSAAHDYLVHRAAVAQAWIDGGESAHDTGVERVGDGYELCHAGEPGAGPLCAEYGGFTHEDGLIDGLLVEGRDPEPGLLVADGAGAETEGVHATLLTAYQSVVDKSLVVTVEFTTADNVDLDLLAAAYRQDGGREHRAHAAVGRFELDAGTATHAAFVFPGAVPGGDLSVGGCLEECSASVDIELPVE